MGKDPRLVEEVGEGEGGSEGTGRGAGAEGSQYLAHHLDAAPRPCKAHPYFVFPPCRCTPCPQASRPM